MIGRLARPARAAIRLITTETLIPRSVRPRTPLALPSTPLRTPSWLPHDVALLGPAGCPALDRLLPPSTSRVEWWMPTEGTAADDDACIDGPETAPSAPLEAIKRTYQVNIRRVARFAAPDVKMRLPWSTPHVARSRTCAR